MLTKDGLSSVAADIDALLIKDSARVVLCEVFCSPNSELVKQLELLGGIG